jgi:transposase-like protein
MTKKAVGNAGKVYKKYTEEFRKDAVRMIETEGLTTAEVGLEFHVDAWRSRIRYSCGVILLSAVDTI